MTSVITMIGSSLQALISSAHDQFVAFNCKGRMLLGASYRSNNSGSSISSSMIVETNSRYQSDESVSYVVPDGATADILLAI